ncbi:MAG: S1 RNA-binding domain-containing protein [Bacilli bacterium]|nr:S1 RNA-binding domain-containing protein [Bacilli bacterium]
MGKYEKGQIVKATVTGITEYGIFVSIDDISSGLVHISEISHRFVRDMNDFVKMGETIYVQILDNVEQQDKLKLSIKNIQYQEGKKKRFRKGIVETPTGFSTLAKKLPLWIKEYEKKQEKIKNSIDKESIK